MPDPAATPPAPTQPPVASGVIYASITTASHRRLAQFILQSMIGVRCSPDAIRDDVKAALEFEAEMESRLAQAAPAETEDTPSEPSLPA